MKSREEINERVRRGPGWGTNYETRKKKRKKLNIDLPTAPLKITCGRPEEGSRRENPKKNRKKKSRKSISLTTLLKLYKTLLNNLKIT